MKKCACVSAKFLDRTQPIVESQRPELLPPRFAGRTAPAFDRMAIAYRSGQTTRAYLSGRLNCGKRLPESGFRLIDDPVLINDWHPVVSSTQLNEGEVLGVSLLGEALVLWRINDRVLAWQDLCIHRGTRLSLGRVEGEFLVCPYHGWTYNEQGRCVRMPAHPDQQPPVKAQANTYRVQEHYGLIWVCLGTPRHEIPPFPEWADPAYRKVLCGPYSVNASGPRIIENFLDIAHFPFVHEGILGVASHPEIEDYEARIEPEGVVATGVRVYQPDPYGTGRGDTVAYTYRAFRPLTAYLLKESTGPRFSILLIITPHDVVESTALMWIL